MASTGQVNLQTALSEELFDKPHRFSFFQAVRLLESLAIERARQEGAPVPAPIGEDGPAAREAVRFRATQTLSFPPNEISGIEQVPPNASAESPARPPEMSVNFLGLTGPSGVLPRHYTSLIVERCQPRHKDRTLRDFLDVFNHRSIAFFYRAWEKWRLPPAYERFHRDRARDDSPQDDHFTSALFALVGLGGSALRRRMEFDDEAILHYAGLFAHHPRCASSLQALAADFFGITAGILQFRGQWLYLDEGDQSSFPTSSFRQGRNLELGTSTVVGSKVWDVQGKFRVRLGALSFRQFMSFLPNGEHFVPLCQLVRLYVGAEFDYDVQLVLKRAEVPQCRLSGDPLDGPRLGWNMWIRSGELGQDAEDAVFSPAGF